jgi:hypothetical protein
VPTDLLLRRLSRTSAVVCLLTAVAGYAVGGPAAAFGVLGGGILIGTSFYLLGSGSAGLSALIAGSTPHADRGRIARGVALKLAGRYALLGFLAYVMIARLRLHPVGVLAGASSVVAAAFVEAVRFLTKNRPF